MLTKRTNQRRRQQQGLPRALVPGSSRPSNPNQIRTQIQVMGTPLYVTVAAGVYANFYAANANQIPNFSSYQSVFEEYRILDVEFEVRCIRVWADSTLGYNWSSPLLKLYLDEDDSAAPTSTSAIQHRGYIVPGAPWAIRDHGYIIKWRAEDLYDLDFLSVGTTNFTPVRLKCFTNTTDFGGSASDSTTRWWIQPTFRIEFRGVGGT